jgi:serine/threonine protein kinase
VTNAPLPRQIKQFKLKDIIGQGLYGIVVSASTGQNVAIKVVRLRRLENCFALASLRHKSIVQLIQIIQALEHIYAVPWRPSRADGVPPVAHRLRPLRADPLSGRLSPFTGIANLGIKPENVLVGDGILIKVADFGASTGFRAGRSTTARPTFFTGAARITSARSASCSSRCTARPATDHQDGL